MTRSGPRTASGRFRHRVPHPLILAAAVIVVGCLDPTGTGGGFGRLSIRPTFEAGAEPAAVQVELDSVRTLVHRPGESSPLVDEVRPYADGADMTWLIELRSSDEDVTVELELRSDGSTLYRGDRVVRVEAGSLGTESVDDVPVAYTGPSLASRIEVSPSRVVLTRLGARAGLRATAFDDAGVALPGRPIAWRSTDEAVATVDDTGEVTATGTGAAWVIASADGAADSASITVDTTLARTTTLTADSASLRADGSATSGVTVRVLDGDGNAVGASAGTVTLSTTLGSVGPVTDQGDGSYTAILTASTSPGTATITGTLNGDAIQDSAVIEIVPGSAAPGTTTITADSTSLVANGTSNTTVTVRVLDAGGNLVGSGGDMVGLSASLGSIGPVTDHGDGTYTATLTASTTPGTAAITGTLNGAPIADSAMVEMRPGEGQPGTSTITADSTSLVANGTSTSTVTVRVLDAGGNLVGTGGDTVVLSTSLGSIGPVTDQGNGTYTATLTTSGTPGTATVTGTLNGDPIQDSAVVEMLPGEGEPGTTTITADSTSLEANGTSTSTVTVRVLDAGGNLVGTGEDTVTLSTSLGSIGPVTDQGNGTYTATLTASSTPGTATVTGTLNGDAIQDSAVVEMLPGEGEAGTTTITADSTSLAANGSSTSTVTVRVLDAGGNLVGTGGDTVALSTSLGELGAMTDHGNGVYTATLTASTTPGTATITGTLNGEAILDSAVVEMLPGEGNPGTTTITADSTSLEANGSSTSTVTVRVLDAGGNLVGTGGDTVALSTSLGSIGPVTDQGNGTYTATLTASTTPGTATITGTLNGDAIQDSAVVEMLPGEGEPGTTTITADSTSLEANGSSTSTVTVRVLDAGGNLVGSGGDTVGLSTSLGSIGEVTDHGNGNYTATLTASSTPGTATVTGTLNGATVQDSAVVEMVAGEGQPGTTTITADSTSLVADGTSTSTVTVRVLDASGNLVGTGGDTVALSTSLGELGAMTDHGNGTYTATLTASTTPGAATVTGTLNGEAIADSAVVEMRALPGDPGKTTITADPTKIAKNRSTTTSSTGLQPSTVIVQPTTSTITVHVLAADGSPVGVGGAAVVLATTLGELGPVTDHGDGTYSATLTAGSTTGTAVITGTLNGQTIDDQATVEIVHD